MGLVMLRDLFYLDATMIKALTSLLTGKVTLNQQHNCLQTGHIENRHSSLARYTRISLLNDDGTSLLLRKLRGKKKRGKKTI